jgi:hypothetical protein
MRSTPYTAPKALYSASGVKTLSHSSGTNWLAYARFPLDALPEDAYRLLQLLYSLIVVSLAVEIWRQPYIPDTGTASFELKLEPVP